MSILSRFVTSARDEHSSLRFVTNRNDVATNRDKIDIFFYFFIFFLEFFSFFKLTIVHFLLFVIIFNSFILNIFVSLFSFSFFISSRFFSFNVYYIYIFMTFVLHLYFQLHDSGKGTRYNLLQFLSF